MHRAAGYASAATVACDSWRRRSARAGQTGQIRGCGRLRSGGAGQPAGRQPLLAGEACGQVAPRQLPPAGSQGAGAAGQSCSIISVNTLRSGLGWRRSGSQMRLLRSPMASTAAAVVRYWYLCRGSRLLAIASQRSSVTSPSALSSADRVTAPGGEPLRRRSCS